MNFRVNLAVALAAAFSFACADKQATIPELEEAMVAPPGTEVIGLYKMTVTPVATADGIQAVFEAIPVGRDGNPNTNPINTVQVSGTFGAVTNTGPGGCAGTNALTAAVRITNFTVDPLNNVWADVIDMSGNTANTACNSSLAEVPFAVSDRSQGIWKYGNLAAAPGTGAAGGSLLPAAAVGGVWGFTYVTLTPFQFYFRIVADTRAPVLANVPTASSTSPITWTSAVAGNTQLEICSSNPGNSTNPCPVATVNQAVAGTGTGPWSYSFAPSGAGFTPGATYWWRARNVYPAPAGTSIFVAPWSSFTYSGALPLVAAKTFLANLPATQGNVAMLTWTTIAAQTDTYAILCAGPCPNTRPAPPPASQQNVLFDGPVAWDGLPLGDGLSHYELDVAALLTPDAATGTYFDPGITYDFRVYDHDVALPAPLFTNPNFRAGSITITAVDTAPVIASPGTLATPVVYTGLGPWNITFTTTSPTTTVMWEIFDLNDPLGLPANASPTPVAGVPGTGVFNYTLDLRPLTFSLGTGNYMVVVYNTDLAGVFGAAHYYNF